MWSVIKMAILLLVVFGVFIQTLLAQNTFLDPSFGTKGYLQALNHAAHDAAALSYHLPNDGTANASPAGTFADLIAVLCFVDTFLSTYPVQLMKRSLLSLTFVCILAALLVAPASAQRDNSKPRPSPNANVSQTVGTSIIDIHYSRPGVKDRDIFGGLQAWGEVWRAGANEPTTITLSDDMMVEGEKLAAGTYSFFLIPQEEGDWTAIFTEPVGWGTDYGKTKDVLRVMVTPEEGDFEEWLSYSFEALSDDSATLVMKWAETVIPVQFTVAGDM